MRLDFWNDPDRWEGIDDPHKQFFWCGPRKLDVIDVREKPKNNGQLLLGLMGVPQSQAAYQNAALQQQSGLAAYQNSPGALIPYRPSSPNSLFGNLL